MLQYRLLVLPLLFLFTGAGWSPATTFVQRSVGNDWITITTGSKAPFALLVSGYFADAETWHCRWQVFQGNGSVPIAVPNLVSVRHCPTEMIVATRGHAMQIIPVDAYTERVGESVIVSSGPMGPSRLPVVARSVDSLLTASLRKHVQKANEVFARCGIKFDLSFEASELLPANRLHLEGAGCDQAAELRKAAGNTRGAVNVFLLRERPHYRGAWCGNGQSPYKDVVLLYRSASETTLAHELGHALALDHPPFIDDNLLADTGNGTHLTLGQCFRSHFDRGSILNASTDAARRRCSDDSKPGDLRCPPLELDVR